MQRIGSSPEAQPGTGRTEAGNRPWGASVDQQAHTAQILKKPYRDVEEKYAMGRELGRGQYGVIRACRERGSGETLACKSISKAKLASPREVEDVQREVRVMQLLKGHPAVIGLKTTYEDAQSVHLIMEVCDGGDLYERISERRRYPEAEAAQVCRALLSVLLQCHRNCVIHRDLKPENVLLVSRTSHTQVKVVDFGLATIIKPGVKLSTVVGSSFYIAPEVLGHSYSYEADMWSVGVILYILLSGVPPFYHPSEKEEVVFEAIRSKPVDVSSGVWEGISCEAKDLVLRMLSRDPRKRISLDRALEHEWIRKIPNSIPLPVLPPPPPPPLPLPPPPPLSSSILDPGGEKGLLRRSEKLSPDGTPDLASREPVESPPGCQGEEERSAARGRVRAWAKEGSGTQAVVSNRDLLRDLICVLEEELKDGRRGGESLGQEREREKSRGKAWNGGGGLARGERDGSRSRSRNRGRDLEGQREGRTGRDGEQVAVMGREVWGMGKDVERDWCSDVEGGVEGKLDRNRDRDWEEGEDKQLREKERERGAGRDRVRGRDSKPEGEGRWERVRARSHVRERRKDRGLRAERGMWLELARDHECGNDQHECGAPSERSTGRVRGRRGGGAEKKGGEGRGNWGREDGGEGTQQDAGCGGERRARECLEESDSRGGTRILRLPPPPPPNLVQPEAGSHNNRREVPQTRKWGLGWDQDRGRLPSFSGLSRGWDDSDPLAEGRLHTLNKSKSEVGINGMVLGVKGTYWHGGANSRRGILSRVESNNDVGKGRRGRDPSARLRDRGKERGKEVDGGPSGPFSTSALKTHSTPHLGSSWSGRYEQRTLLSGSPQNADAAERVSKTQESSPLASGVGTVMALALAFRPRNEQSASGHGHRRQGSAPLTFDWLANLDLFDAGRLHGEVDKGSSGCVMPTGKEDEGTRDSQEVSAEVLADEVGRLSREAKGEDQGRQSHEASDEERRDEQDQGAETKALSLSSEQGQDQGQVQGPGLFSAHMAAAESGEEFTGQHGPPGVRLATGHRCTSSTDDLVAPPGSAPLVLYRALTRSSSGDSAGGSIIAAVAAAAEIEGLGGSASFGAQPSSPQGPTRLLRPVTALDRTPSPDVDRGGQMNAKSRRGQWQFKASCESPESGSDEAAGLHSPSALDSASASTSSAWGVWKQKVLLPLGQQHRRKFSFSTTSEEEEEALDSLPRARTDRVQDHSTAQRLHPARQKGHLQQQQQQQEELAQPGVRGHSSASPSASSELSSDSSDLSSPALAIKRLTMASSAGFVLPKATWGWSPRVPLSFRMSSATHKSPLGRTTSALGPVVVGKEEHALLTAAKAPQTKPQAPYSVGEGQSTEGETLQLEELGVMDAPLLRGPHALVEEAEKGQGLAMKDGDTGPAAAKSGDQGLSMPVLTHVGAGGEVCLHGGGRKEEAQHWLGLNWVERGRRVQVGLRGDNTGRQVEAWKEETKGANQEFRDTLDWTCDTETERDREGSRVWDRDRDRDREREKEQNRLGLIAGAADAFRGKRRLLKHDQ